MAKKNETAAVDSTPLEVTVARSRTVIFEGEYYGPGKILTLPGDEVARLRRLGFLVDPNVEPPPTANGPTFEQSSGPQVKRVA